MKLLSLFSPFYNFFLLCVCVWQPVRKGRKLVFFTLAFNSFFPRHTEFASGYSQDNPHLLKPLFNVLSACTASTEKNMMTTKREHVKLLQDRELFQSAFTFGYTCCFCSLSASSVLLYIYLCLSSLYVPCTSSDCLQTNNNLLLHDKNGQILFSSESQKEN